MSKQTMLTSKEAAERLGCSLEAVQRRCQVGTMPGAVKVGKDWQIPEKELAKVKIIPRRRGTNADTHTGTDGGQDTPQP